MYLHLVFPGPMRVTSLDAIRGQSVTQQLPFQPGNQRDDEKWHYRLSGTGEVWELEFEALVDQPGDKLIFVYEESETDSVFLHQQDNPLLYQVRPAFSKTTINGDAQAIHEGDTSDWSEEWVHPWDVAIEDLLPLIAIWHPAGFIEYTARPGRTGLQFLDLFDPDEEV